MRPSSSHSFAVFAFSLFASSALSIDSNAAAGLRPRLDDGYAPSSAVASPSSLSKKKCHSALSSTSQAFTAESTNSASQSMAPSISPALSTGVSAGFVASGNASALASSLGYARTSKKKCTKTGTVYAPKPSELSPVDTPSDQNGTPNSPASAVPGGGSPIDSAGTPGDSTPAGAATPQDSGSSNQNSPVGGGSPGSCGPQSTVTVTTQKTVTVTATPANAAPTDQNAIQPTLPPSSAAAKKKCSKTPSLSDSPVATGASTPAGGRYNDTLSNAPVGNSTVSAKKKCSGKPSASGPSSAVAPLSTGSGSSYASPAKDVYLEKPASTHSREPMVSSVASGSGSTGSDVGASKMDNYYFNKAVKADGILPAASNKLLKRADHRQASRDHFSGQFWAGATIGTVLRMEAIPERKFYGWDNKTVADPIKTLADANVNAIRVETSRGQCLGPSKFVNDGLTLGKELTFSLDWGCIDTQVKTAQQATALGMRLQLTINQGFNISEEQMSYTYEEMIADIQKETKRQLQPFLDVKIVPDIILLENEGTDGILFTEPSGHIRGGKDGKASDAKVDQELCGQIPTGNMDSYPQLAGYYKAEIIACNEAIAAAGLSNDTVRYGLHSHGQYVQWKEGIVHGIVPGDERTLLNSAGHKCPAQVIPAHILAANASEMLTIAGFSAYPDPMTPTDITSKASMEATLDRLTTTLTQLQNDAERYGKFESGPFKGQYKLQGLGVEYATSYTTEQIPWQIAHTELMWKTVKGFSAFLGMLWYEPWYCHADFEGGTATLCFDIDKNGISGQAPTDTLKTWGAAAISPWRKAKIASRHSHHRHAHFH